MEQYNNNLETYVSDEELQQALRDTWMSSIEVHQHDVPTEALGCFEYRSFYGTCNNPYEDYWD